VGRWEWTLNTVETCFSSSAVRRSWRRSQTGWSSKATGHDGAVIDVLIPIAQETRAEVALLHLNFIEGGGGIVAGWFLREATRTTRIVAYTGGALGPGLAIAQQLGLADRVVTTSGLFSKIHEILPALVSGARADRVETQVLSSALRVALSAGRTEPRPVHLSRLHDAIDRAIIEQLLDWLGGVRPVAAALRIPRQTLRSKMTKLGIEWPRATPVGRLTRPHRTRFGPL
jgi:hypothetical protein